MAEQKLPAKSYIGYDIADLGNNIAFSAASTYLTLFYTDVLGKNFSADVSAKWLTAITIIMVIARVWDGINDPMMGVLAQHAKPTKWGKFRPYLLFGGIPLAFSAILMFAPIPNMTLAGCIVFALVTYILYGMLYTVVLVPYGSLATVMTRNENERSRLSIARSIGGGIGGVPAGMLFPIIIYDNVNGVSTLNGNKLVIAMSVIAVIMIIAYILAFSMTKEVYEFPPVTQKVDIKKLLKNLIKNKPFVIMSLAGMLLIASSMYINTIDVYLFNVYYQKTGMMTFVTIATYAPMVVMIPFTEKIIKKIGKKEMCVIGLIVSTIATLIMTAWRIPNAWVFIAFCVLQGAGISFFTLEIWALAMDVIDYQEMLTGEREEAPTYAVFTFMRKIGQALAAIVPLLLTKVGYVSGNGYLGQEAGVPEKIYLIATVVPLIMFILMLVLLIIYPLNKKKDIEMRETLKVMRESAENVGENVEAVNG